MKVDLEQIRHRYASMSDQEFRAIRRSDLTPEARGRHDQELARRDPASLAAVREQDILQAEFEARMAAAGAQDPEPKAQWYMATALGLACVTTVLVLIVALMRLQRDLPIETHPLLVLGGIWISALTAYMPHWRAKAEWREHRRRKETI